MAGTSATRLCRPGVLLVLLSLASRGRPFALEPSKVHVLMNGLPGAMGREVAAACLRKGIHVAPYAFTGPDVEPGDITVGPEIDGEGTTQVTLVHGPPADTDGCKAAVASVRESLGDDDILIAIDYTHPMAVNSNAELYADLGLPFVVGTTGGDREALKASARRGGWAVVAPNMGKGIVALQAGVERLAASFPAAFAGYDLTVRESHQKTKADTSGTALAVAESLAVLTGDAFDPEAGIERIRSDEGSMDFGVPEDSLGGHAFHTYSLKSKDGSVEFQIRHNVCGRRVYADGTADAVLFLARRIAEGGEPRVFSMIDVLSEGGI